MNKINTFKKSIYNRHVAVIGIGVSNLPLIKFLRRCGAIVTAFDKKTKDQLGDTYNDLYNIGVEFSLGENYLKDIKQEIIFKTPGMRPDIAELEKARRQGSIITSEMEIFFNLCPAPIIGVTGSDGKTTTSTLIYKILKNEGYTCWLGGNIGNPLIGDIENIKPHHKVILELSSFQLFTLKSSPDIAIISNITPNHLDMHTSMEEYINAKKNIFKNQSINNKLILNFDNEITKAFKEEAGSQVRYFSRKSKKIEGVFLNENKIFINDGGKIEQVIDKNDIILLGDHNIENYMAAIAGLWGLVSVSSIKKTATTFKGVDHRLEFVKEIRGIKFYNDSIASTPTRTIAGLKSFKNKLVLIAGGYDKNISFDDLGKEILNTVKQLVLIGATSNLIEEAVNDAAKSLNLIPPPIYKALDLNQAINKTLQISNSGDIVLLSPACASFDMFKDFIERGNAYKKIVNDLV